ncbi:MAG: hypothetical protein WCS90_03020, partial [Bacilli bacterium]
GIPSDIYSMGILFFEILVGNVPFDGNTPEEVAIAQIKKHFPEPSRFVTSVPRSIDRIVVKACRKSPDERFFTSLEMHDAIEEAMKDQDSFKERKGFFSRLFGFK